MSLFEAELLYCRLDPLPLSRGFGAGSLRRVENRCGAGRDEEAGVMGGGAPFPQVDSTVHMMAEGTRGASFGRHDLHQLTLASSDRARPMVAQAVPQK